MPRIASTSPANAFLPRGGAGAPGVSQAGRCSARRASAARAARARDQQCSELISDTLNFQSAGGEPGRQRTMPWVAPLVRAHADPLHAGSPGARKGAPAGLRAALAPRAGALPALRRRLRCRGCYRMQMRPLTSRSCGSRRRFPTDRGGFLSSAARSPAGPRPADPRQEPGPGRAGAAQDILHQSLHFSSVV
ncbi:hypothetical protein NDU88_003216 [Pleurodeles waltl]|uniref:Uncharacterized protein n=1 Tax=Pleurodeles waltl TaxID=8319 RepID=A0AAV7UZE0_PLEWA|nr:hypothetical protein NDU88_003216 [Pleurodeles waltl]